MRSHSQNSNPQRVKEEDYARLLNKKQRMALSEYPKEQVDGALALMVLSRDEGNLGNGISGFSDKSFSNQRESVFEDNGDGSLKKKKKKKKKIGSNGFEAGVLGYQCSICGAGFRSGQALGGHKRAHWAKATQRIVYDDADLCGQRLMI
ncbi:uncharacterized protein A4U43_C03F20490 [Asparagus officinalis]|uniref:C2H2-type domain-containing protein n=1 Tax=Asparagus officinalis TaxID=4686 RepID=A0A5P1FGM7_ASPOF|nr:uncharacterized protein A4U43_C03F20490 [Asparagus officinalis]